MIRIGVIGYGYWGPNIVRNFHAHEDSEVVLVCDKSTKCQQRLHKAHPSIAFTMDADEVLKSPNIDLVAVRRVGRQPLRVKQFGRVAKNAA